MDINNKEMKNWSKSMMFWVLIIGITSCFSTKKIGKQPNFSDILLIQNGVQKRLQTGVDLSIEKAPFKIQFYNHKYDETAKRYYAAKIAALPTVEDLNGIKAGMLIENIPNLGPGSGLASTRYDGYEALFINDYGHHYLFYEDSTSHQVDMLTSYGNELLLSFNIPKLYMNDQFYDFSDSPVEKLYLAIVIDRNLDGRLDANELTKVTINLR